MNNPSDEAISTFLLYIILVWTGFLAPLIQVDGPICNILSIYIIYLHEGLISVVYLLLNVLF